MTLRRVLAVLMICLFTLLLAGCGTSFDEWSGTMSNETGRHEHPYDYNQPDDNSEAIRPARLRLAATPALASTPAVRQPSPRAE
ncbi:MAG: hypothetical protein ACRD1N_01975 [Terriglobia bacterium]